MMILESTFLRFQIFGYKITLKHLATHTSGIRDQWDLLKLAGWRMDDVINNEHIFKTNKTPKRAQL